MDMVNKKTKEQLIKENQSLKERLNNSENYIEHLEKDISNLKYLQDININLQVELSLKNKEYDEVLKNNHILANRVETYEEVFNLLKDKNER